MIFRADRAFLITDPSIIVLPCERSSGFRFDAVLFLQIETLVGDTHYTLSKF